MADRAARGSLEEVVFDLAKEFGAAAVMGAAKDLQSSSLAHEEPCDQTPSNNGPASVSRSLRSPE
jgi:hypothetical protein